MYRVWCSAKFPVVVQPGLGLSFYMPIIHLSSHHIPESLQFRLADPSARQTLDIKWHINRLVYSSIGHQPD